MCFVCVRIPYVSKPRSILILKSNRWTNAGGDTGDSLKLSDATLILCVIYMHVSHTRDLSSSGGLPLVALSRGLLETIIYNNNSPGFSAQVKRKFTIRGFLKMGTSKIEQTSHLRVFQ